MMIIPHKNPGGRPPAVIDLMTVERAASIGCTVEEIAAILGIARSTLFERKANDPAIEDAIEKGRETGRATLRRLQWDRAQQGSDTMLIWLGKQMLGQRDNAAVAVALSGPKGGPVQSERVTVSITDPIEAARVYQKLMGEDK